VGARLHDANGVNSGAAYVYNMQKEPQIVSISDVPNDQGGVVSIQWNASYWDIGHNLSYYSIWRSTDGNAASGQVSLLKQNREQDHMVSASLADDPSRDFSAKAKIDMAGLSWEWIADVPGHRYLEYTFSAPTLFDSMATTDGKHYFLISAHLDDPALFFDSAIDSGYSVDNLAPDAPAGLQAVVAENQVELSWKPASEPDFASFIVYKDHAMLASTGQTAFSDADVLPGQTVAYQLQAKDVHGNASALSAEVTVLIAGVDADKSKIPGAFSLSNNYPNPFNSGTEFEYAVPKKCRVELSIYDILGHKVVTLTNAEHGSGLYKTRWDGNDSDGKAVSSGIYLCVFKTEGFVDQKKMTLMR
jgi:hypothetical protein